MASKECRSCGEKLKPGKAQCVHCRAWNDPSNHQDYGLKGATPLDRIQATDPDRIKTGPWDDALGGGIVVDSVILIGGEPGAGKSTIALQICGQMASKRRILYIATEESPGQIKARADRLGVQCQDRIKILYPENMKYMQEVVEDQKPAGIVLDSLPGLIGYDEKKAVLVCEFLKRHAIEFSCPSIIVDHINKEGDLAGMMRLQHVVDVVMTFRPGPKYRTLRAEKNRHGEAFKECLLAMTPTGLAPYLEQVKSR